MSGDVPPPTSSPPSSKMSSTSRSVSEEKETPTKARRPLPVPKEKVIPVVVEPISSSSSYASSKPIKHSNTHTGTTHTNYLVTSPAATPSREMKSQEAFREPELVAEDQPPKLMPISENSGWGSTWGAEATWPTESTPWDPNWDGWGGWDTKKVPIDGRKSDEEINWCDAELRARSQRPGPGILPPLLSDLLHNPDHNLYSVTASAPPSKLASGVSASSLSTTSAPPSSTQPFAHAPTADEIRVAIPHPNAYYCKEHNGWVLLMWRSSSVLPPIVSSFTSQYPFPDVSRRRRTISCIGTNEQSSARTNATHHFHRYERAVDARTLTTPYKRSDWEIEVQQKQRRRKMTLHLDETVKPAAESPPVSGDEIIEDEKEGDLLDLYVCCQCSVYCLASQVIPGVIPARYVEEFTKDKLAHPPVDKTPKASVVAGWETIITILENRLWKGEERVLPVSRPRFQSKLGWNDTIRRIFQLLDFTAQSTTSQSGATDKELAIHPPMIDPAIPQGRRTRAKLLRAWVEVSAWLWVYNKSKSTKDGMGNYHPQTLHVSLEHAREMYQTGIGAHVNQIPRGLLPFELIGWSELDKDWEGLGITPNSYNPELLMFAYLAQCRCNPRDTITYFTHLLRIAESLKSRTGTAPDELQTLIASERSRDRFTHENLEEAVRVLGFGKDNDLGVELDEDVDDDFILQAWKSGIKRAWKDTENGRERITELNEAFKMIADAKGSPALRQAYERGKSSAMSPDAAYSTLEVPKDMDESMLITIYSMRVEDQPSHADKMREALTVIAEVRDSQRLKDFLSTGQDPGEISPETRLDMPRGLNQLGNTCYLNSLLQYFYTIKDLREAVSPLASTAGKLDDIKFTDDDLKRHRVGGRLVTRREIHRSKKFVTQLAELFWNLEYCDTAAVTPSIDLAKLALVTSQDEEDDAGAGTDSSNDTDATLVEDGPVRPTHERSDSQSSIGSPKSPTVLGKRNRDQPKDSKIAVSPTIEAIEDKDKDGYVIVSRPPSPASTHPPSASPSSSKLKRKSSERKSPEQQDVEMRDTAQKTPIGPKPPPLPPRKPKEREDSVMMFGRQHDVSECMDNCMFQIETALLDFHEQDKEMASVESDKMSVVKRLFYGRKRQKLTPLRATTPERRARSSSVHEKEDLFSHLHVNVSDEGFDLYDCLARYFDDVVDFDGVRKRMEVTLVDLPPLLQIQLQRVQFDRETQQAYKSQAYVKFGETLFMDRFTESAPEEKKVRSKVILSQLNTSRDRIQRLTQGKHAPFAPALGSTAEFLSKQDALQIAEVDEDFVTKLGNEQAYVASRLETERAAAKKLKEELEELWKNEKEVAYELTSVFIHRGSSPSYGHYFFYARNLPDKPDEWFKYNDSSVTIVSKEEVLADTTGSTANPYMLVFSRKDQEVIRAVHRFDPDSLQDT